MTESASLRERREVDLYEEREVSESATLNVGRGTRHDFRADVECRARIVVPCAEDLLGFASCVPTLIEGIDHDKDRANDVQVFKWFQDEGFEQGTMVTGATLKIGVVLYDLSEGDFKRRIVVGEMASKSRRGMRVTRFCQLCPHSRRGHRSRGCRGKRDKRVRCLKWGSRRR
jgi:hypothetical protein